MPLRNLSTPILRPPRGDCVPPTRPDPYAPGSIEAVAIASILDYFDEDLRGLDDREKMYCVSNLLLLLSVGMARIDSCLRVVV